MRLRGQVLKKKQALYVEFNEEVEAATNSY